VERRPVERVRGTQDLWPAEARQLHAVRRRLERAFARAGYRPVDVPVLEPAELHLRKSGLEIISKLYAFDDLGGRRLCLRPELTASVVRAFVAQPAPRLPAKVYSSGPVFRYERPSKGRYRQFTQAGVELIGATGPLADAEAIGLAADALTALGLRDFRVVVGHVGILSELLSKLGLSGRLRAQLMDSLEPARRHGLAAVRAGLRELDPELFEPPPAAPDAPPIPPAPGAEPAARAGQVRVATAGLLGQLGADSLGRRSESEVVERLLRKLEPETSRRAAERALDFIAALGAVRGAPDQALAAGRRLLQEYGLEAAPLEGLEETVGLLDGFGVDLDHLRIDLGLSRGLQYYTGMVFEIDHGGLGAESQLCGGGRYDDLFRALGGRTPIPALGFAFGVERVRLALVAEGVKLDAAPVADVLVVPASAPQAAYAGRVARAIRLAGRRADLDVTGRSLRAALAYADREGYPAVAVVGAAEAEAGTVRLRDMAAGAERTAALGAAGGLWADAPGEDGA
jgi:histidyl-tRNA synthetase